MFSACPGARLSFLFSDLTTSFAGELREPPRCFVLSTMSDCADCVSVGCGRAIIVEKALWGLCLQLTWAANFVLFSRDDFVVCGGTW